jgi:hypothetical protein
MNAVFTNIYAVKTMFLRKLANPETRFVASICDLEIVELSTTRGHSRSNDSSCGTAFEQPLIYESKLQPRAKAVSPLRSATALQDASAESAVVCFRTQELSMKKRSAFTADR